jgi:hypothetical protein
MGEENYPVEGCLNEIIGFKLENTVKGEALAFDI